MDAPTADQFRRNAAAQQQQAERYARQGDDARAQHMLDLAERNRVEARKIERVGGAGFSPGYASPFKPDPDADPCDACGARYGVVRIDREPQCLECDATACPECGEWGEHSSCCECGGMGAYYVQDRCLPEGADGPFRCTACDGEGVSV